MDLLFALYALPVTILGYLIHIIIHEIGHMLAGLVTVWKFVVLQLFYMETLYYDMLMDLLHKNITVLSNPCYGAKIDQYIKKHETTGDIHMARIKAVWVAYQCYIDGDITAGIEYLNKAIIELQSMRCLYQGEKIFCIDQLQGIRNILWRDSVMIG